MILLSTTQPEKSNDYQEQASQSNRRRMPLMTDCTRLPQGYDLNTVPADYTGKLWIEGQMRAYSDAENAALLTNLGNLLAILHGDGGHYENEHGTDKAAADAIDKFHERIVQADAEQFALTEKVRVLRDALQDVFIFIGQGGSAYEISQRTTPIIRAAMEMVK